jgi:hypothetical protein
VVRTAPAKKARCDLLERTAELSASYSDEQLTLLLDLLERFRTLITEHTATLRARAADDRATTPGGRPGDQASAAGLGDR